MKTVTDGKDVKRVSDKEVSKYIKEGWKYCAKSIWKEPRRKQKGGADAKDQKGAKS